MIRDLGWLSISGPTGIRILGTLRVGYTPMIPLVSSIQSQGKCLYLVQKSLASPHKMADSNIPQSAGSSDAEKRSNGPIHSERKIKIICIGAGASGLLFAYKVQRNFRNFELVIYEKNEEVAGTWFENKYPGCACKCKISPTRFEYSSSKLTVQKVMFPHITTRGLSNQRSTGLAYMLQPQKFSTISTTFRESTT
jgi:hypothetical protein